MKGSFAKFLDPSRSIQAKLSVQDIRLRFAGSAMPVLANATCHDAGFNGASIIQVAVVAGRMYQHNITGFPNWNASAAWASGSTCDRAVMTDDAKFLVYSRGTSVYRRNFTGTVAGSEVLLYTSPTPNFSLAVYYNPVDPSLTVVVAFEITDTNTAGWYAGTVVQRVYDRFWTPVGGAYTWDGYVTMDTNTAPVLDAIAGLIFFTDHSGKRTVWMKFIPGGVGSDTGNVMLLDITDDTAFFKLNSATLGLDGFVYLSGISSRQNSRPMTIYTACDALVKAEAEFSFGRDMYIKSNNVDTDTEGIGKLLFTPQGAFYLGPDKLYVANNGSTIQSPFVTGNGTNINSLSTAGVNCGPNQPFTLTAEIASSDAGVGGLAAGSIVSLSAGSNNDPLEKLYMFGVDQVEASSTQLGKNAVIRGSSLAMKKLNEWTSDSAFDYWSQSKIYADTKDRTALVGTGNQWDENSGVLTLKDLNTDGIMYTTERSSDGCSARIHFLRKTYGSTQGPGTFDTQVGLVVNYQKETMAQAALRLKIDIAKVTDEQCGRSGIFVIQQQPWNNSAPLAPVVRVLLYNTLSADVWYSLGFYALDVPFDTWVWLMVTFREGQVNVYYATDNAITHARNWSLVGSLLAYPSYPTEAPWDRDTNGRAGVYVQNITPSSVSYPFSTDSTVVPVYQNFSFPDADTIQVDSEQIAYTGKSGCDSIIENLAFKYGREVIAQSSNSLTNVYNWQLDRHTNAIKQTFTTTGTQYIRGVFVKIGKVGSPADGLELRIYNGSETVTSAFGDLKASAQVDASQILDVSKVTTLNGWVFFSFYEKVAINNGDRIWLTRTQNGSSPNSSSYYTTWLTTGVAGMKMYRWGNQDYIDTGTGYYEVKVGGLSCAIPFKMFAYNEAPDTGLGGMGSVCVTTDPLLSHTDNYYNNYALNTTGGSGTGTVYKITGFKWAADVCFFYVEKSPGFGFDETTKLSVTPALYNLTCLSPGAHSLSRADTYRAEPMALIGKFGYFSKDMDRSLYNYVNTICAKAGVLNLTTEMAYPDIINILNNGSTMNRRNLIFRTCPIVSDLASVTYMFRMTEASDASLTVSPTQMAYTSSDGTTEAFPFAYSPYIPALNWLTISLYDKFLSVWMGNRQVHTFVLTDADAALAGDGFFVTGTAFQSANVHMEVPEACVRIDNYVLDIGKTGASMIDEIIGNKRFYYQDDQNGGLYLFRNRVDANNSLTPYVLATDYSEAKTDTGKVTRVLLEGGLVVERFDPTEMVEHGNLFSRMNIFEIMNEDDAKFFADKILYELSTQDVQIKLAGAAWPKLDTEDMFYAQVPSGLKHIIVDTLNYSFAINENEAASNMEMTGRSI